MKINRIPRLVDRFFPKRVWDFSSVQPVLYLTFDDGPVPGITDWVLNTLNVYEAKATFFCVGENVTQHPELFQRVMAEGHSVGNHTMNHLNGWKTKQEVYLDNVKQASEFIPGKLFRPPYGRMTRKQAMKLSQDYTIVMWRFLAFDFRSEMDMKAVFERYTRKWKPGDIIVLHDNPKSFDQMKIFLTFVLNWGKEQGIRFEAIPSDVCK
jgi:peptidoglycan-N-acetylglucosamine deacetylase